MPRRNSCTNILRWEPQTQTSRQVASNGNCPLTDCRTVGQALKVSNSALIEWLNETDTQRHDAVTPPPGKHCRALEFALFARLIDLQCKLGLVPGMALAARQMYQLLVAVTCPHFRLLVGGRCLQHAAYFRRVRTAYKGMLCDAGQGESLPPCHPREVRW